MYRPASVQNILLKTKPCERMVFLIFWAILKKIIYPLCITKTLAPFKKSQMFKIPVFKNKIFPKNVSAKITIQ